MVVSPVIPDPISRLRTALDRIAFALEQRKVAPAPPPEPVAPAPGPDLEKVVASIDLLMARIQDVLGTEKPEPAASDTHYVPDTQYVQETPPVHAAEPAPAEPWTEPYNPAPRYDDPPGNNNADVNNNPSWTEDPWQNAPAPDSHNPSSSWNEPGWSEPGNGSDVAPGQHYNEQRHGGEG
ncbi:hypothetical protein [Acetobacter oeni]|uniref:Uncharacterized protein n=2 Tax=Acetobacter oeni TaxID=304077 RepID=A0A511XN22_9PROT|nr:hypothetical protein [Acetobacter oeni]MBB3881610.1 hypothetical protein [Acetobacter oeni]GBR04954.1 hypothetical protein AA21952_1582 [Acetobacter oeni LMG 21952]GEN64350.1 hypothetical protein AOE01nite_25740 [Acetobacter oeni]